ncbi:TPA: hypothetical protein I8372_004767 [Citrobacter farmeri]|nr:hypothetical protein [Citrobacter farmeri]HAT2779589.1 hypothetical protein [Citrobacter farmeri]HAT2810552.1 hypothetical protein [Citrobacter farmeri]HBC0550365.1 hypothetical protein [Citrobacter farmeri]
MLDGYYGSGMVTTEEQRKRLLAVQAAIEIAKASVGSSDAAVHSRVGDDIDAVAEKISALADAIQNALD